MRRFSAYFLAASLASPVGTLYGQVERGKEFKTKVLGEWKSLLEKIGTAQWERRVEYHSPHSPHDPKHFRLDRLDVGRFAFDRNVGALALSQVDRLYQKKKVNVRRDQLQIINRQYTAELSKKKAGGWMLSQFKQDSKGAAKRLGEEVRCPWMVVGNMELHRWLPEPGFVFTRIEKLPEGSATAFFRTSFAYNGSRGEASDAIKSGSIDFDPAHSYRPMRFQFNLKTEDFNGIIHGVLEYETVEGIPVLKASTVEEEHRSKRKGLIFGKEITTFSNVNYNKDIPDEEFRLSFYGLPEPQGVIWVSNSRWYLWFIAAGGVSLMIGAYFRHRVQRRNLADAQPPSSSGAQS